MHQGELPLDWKQANIVPIFKKGNRAHATITIAPFLLLVFAVKSWNV